MEQYENQEIDIKELFDLLVSQIRLIGVIVAICVVLTTIITVFVIDKKYESYTTLLLGTTNSQQESEDEITYNDVILNQKLVSTYGEIVKSKVVTNQVIDSVGLNISPQQLSSMITVTNVKDTEILKITVKHTNPATAAKLANEVASKFKEYITTLLKLNNVTIIDKAEENNNAVSPSKVRNIGISFVLGLMIGVFVVLLREYLNTKIKSPEDIESICDYPLLGVIPESKLLSNK